MLIKGFVDLNFYLPVPLSIRKIVKCWCIKYRVRESDQEPWLGPGPYRNDTVHNWRINNLLVNENVVRFSYGLSLNGVKICSVIGVFKYL